MSNYIQHSKMVCFAYPSSDTAKKLGKNDSGCWFVEIYAGVQSWQKIKMINKPFPSPQLAIEFADALPSYPYHFTHDKYVTPYLDKINPVY